jgi:hypothetical protein
MQGFMLYSLLGQRKKARPLMNLALLDLGIFLRSYFDAY